MQWCCACRVAVSASSRCALGNSPETLKDDQGNPNTEPGKTNVRTEPGNFSWDTSSKTRFGSGADAWCRRAGNTRCESRKKPSIRKHATSAAKPIEQAIVGDPAAIHSGSQPTSTPQAAELPVAGLMSMSAAKAVAVSAPRPDYSYEAKRAHITSSGVCVMTVDTVTGKVTSAMMEQRVGNEISR